VSAVTIEESNLLMTFLDDVLPRQYPMHKSTVSHGGRGWLLNLLINVKPLYHAALALSAHYCQVMDTTPARQSWQTAMFHEQERHLGICLELVSQSAQLSCPNQSLGLAASVIQLLFFEVCSRRQIFLLTKSSCLLHQQKSSLLAMGLLGKHISA
jgi:C6 transcription factor Pro1